MGTSHQAYLRVSNVAARCFSREIRSQLSMQMDMPTLRETYIAVAGWESRGVFVHALLRPPQILANVTVVMYIV